MKMDQLYQELKHLADQLNLQVTEQNFRNTGVPVKSGYCIVKNKDCCIINKHLKLEKKVEALAECISHFSFSDIYMLPIVREFLDRFKPEKPERNAV